MSAISRFVGIARLRIAGIVALAALASSFFVGAATAGAPPCQVASVQELTTTYENITSVPTSPVSVVAQPDASGVYQVYTLPRGKTGPLSCITCSQVPGGPAVNHNKMMVSFHPSGKWIVVGVEEDLTLPEWLYEWFGCHICVYGWEQTGTWLNMWITTPTGDKWYQMTNFNNGANATGADGFVGISFTPDGKTALWTEIVAGDVINTYKLGKWRLYKADFSVSSGGSPLLTNQLDITPADANWVEPGNISPDGQKLLISTDIGLDIEHVPTQVYGQDQWSVNISTGALAQLTNTPNVWDEHGLYSPNGAKITWMSSLPYESDPNSYQLLSLKTEFMLMNSDGSGVQQLTHFNTPGYPESQSSRTVAAAAWFLEDGSLFATVMTPSFGKTNWSIKFKGSCGI